MEILLLFLFVLVVVFAAVAFITRPTRTEKLAHSRFEAATGRSDPYVVQQVDILRHDTYSNIPWLNRLLNRFRIASGLRRLIAEADLNWTVGRLLLGSLIALFAVYWIGSFAYPDSVIVPVLAVCAFLSPFSFIYFRRNQQVRRFSKILPDAMDLVSRALRAGHSLTAAIDLVGQEIADPVGKEFRRISEEQNLGLPLRDALLNFADRMPIPDVQFLVAAMLIQRETGGNLVEVLDKTTTLLRERMRLQGEIRIYTAQGRLTGWILCLLPIGMYFALSALNPEYTKPLTEDPMGRKLLIMGSCLMFLGVLVIRKIIRIKV
jgi:tight adherence protein B